MVNVLNRRAALSRITAVLGVAATGILVAGCKSTTVGNTTTASLDVRIIDNYAQGIINGGEALLSAPAVTLLLGDKTSGLIGLIIDDISKMLSAFDTAANGSVTVTYDNTNGWTAATTILSDAQNLLSTLTSTISQAQIAGLPNDVQNIIAAIRTVVILLQTAITTAEGLFSSPHEDPPMTEYQALHVLNVKGY